MKKPFFLILILLNSSCSSIKFLNDYSSLSNSTSSYSTDNANLQNWHNLDPEIDAIPGTSVERAYKELLKDLDGNKVIVAIIDTGLDIEHENLSNNIWINNNEIVNGLDDDNNGYVDDINGWNYLGSSYNETREMTRLLRDNKVNNRKYSLVEEEIKKEIKKSNDQLNILNYYIQILEDSKELISGYLGNDKFGIDDVNKIETEDEKLIRAKTIYKDFESYGYTKEYLNEGIEQYNDFINFHFNVEFNGRTANDDIYDINDTNYGDSNINNIKDSESHSTHVSGIISGDRHNNDGNKGINNLVEIMVLRAIPNGDEYDKDVALAIRYAVDNGAKVINTSFGKGYSQNPEWVWDAIKYAGTKDVLIVNAAGNDGLDLDITTSYPNDQNGTGAEMSDNFITIGALNYKYGEEMVATFSNYGATSVDLFSPGVKIWSTTPLDTYEYLQGTSMASPDVAGVAAMIRSYYPKLSAKQVKQVLMDSGLHTSTPVIVGGEESNIQPFDAISKSGNTANLYNALIMASKM